MFRSMKHSPRFIPLVGTFYYKLRYQMRVLSPYFQALFFVPRECVCSAMRVARTCAWTVCVTADVLVTIRLIWYSIPASGVIPADSGCCVQNVCSIEPPIAMCSNASSSVIAQPFFAGSTFFKRGFLRLAEAPALRVLLARIAAARLPEMPCLRAIEAAAFAKPGCAADIVHLSVMFKSTRRTLPSSVR